MKNRIVSAGILAVATFASLTAVTPATAQPVPGYFVPAAGGWDRDAFWRGAPESPYERIRFLQDRIDRGRADGSLNRREADRASRELNGIRNWARRMHFEDGGRLDPRQIGALQVRLDQLSQQIRWMKHNGW